MSIKQSHKSDRKKAQDELFEYLISTNFKIDYERLIRLAHKADIHFPIGDKKEMYPLVFKIDPRTGLKFKTRLESQQKPNRLRWCTECKHSFIFLESGHRNQCSEDCFKKYKARVQKERRAVKRKKRYEEKPPNDRPDGFCKICHQDILYRRAGALVCENPAHRKQWNRMKRRGN